MRYSAAILGLIVGAYWVGVGVQILRVARLRRRLPAVVPGDWPGRAIWLLLTAAVTAWLVLPWVVAFGQPGDLPAWLSPIPALDAPAAHWTGLIVAAAAFAGTLVCWVQMGDSWQMAINGGPRTDLVTHGIYAHVRHPIYLLGFILMASSLVVIPTPLAFLMAAVYVACLTTEAIREERYLYRRHGADYQRYVARTGRFLPKSLRTAPQRHETDARPT